MYVVVDQRADVAGGFTAMFGREGFPQSGSIPSIFANG